MNILSRAIAILAIIAAGYFPAVADPGNLDAGFPVQMEDADPIDPGGRQMRGSLYYDRQEAPQEAETDHEYRILPGFVMGLKGGWQVQAEIPFLFGTGDTAGTGDIHLEALRKLSNEKRRMPALAVSGRLEFPAGAGSSGLDYRLKLIASKTVARKDRQRIHLNLAYAFNGSPKDTERSNPAVVAFGYSRNVTPATVFVADIVRELERGKNRESNIVELGARHVLGSLIEIGVAMGAGFGDESPGFIVRSGLQFLF